MGKQTRRGIMGTALLSVLTGAIQCPAVATAQKRRVTQSELDKAIRCHELWLMDISKGQRAVFNECDLSGLSFHPAGSRIDLTGADFTQAILEGITGNEILFKCASLQGADLRYSRIDSPIFANSNLARSLCGNVSWGKSTRIELSRDFMIDGPSATFMNCYLGDSSFEDAEICGFFSSCTFHNGNLRRISFKGSRFSGNRTYAETSFAGCDLTDATFRETIIDGVNFNKANLSGVDFENATLGRDIRGLAEVIVRVRSDN